MNEPKLTFCATWREKHVATCPDDLQPAEQEAFNIHVVSCPLCMAAFADYHKMDALIRNALIPKHSLGLWKDFLSAQDDVGKVLPTESPDTTSFRHANKLNKKIDNHKKG